MEGSNKIIVHRMYLLCLPAYRVKRLRIIVQVERERVRRESLVASRIVCSMLVFCLCWCWRCFSAVRRLNSRRDLAQLPINMYVGASHFLVTKTSHSLKAVGCTVVLFWHSFSLAYFENGKQSSTNRSNIRRIEIRSLPNLRVLRALSLATIIIPKPFRCLVDRSFLFTKHRWLTERRNALCSTGHSY